MFVLQPPVDYLRLKIVGRKGIRERDDFIEDDLRGFCFFEGKIFVVFAPDSGVDGCSIGVYRARFHEGVGAIITHLDSMALAVDCRAYVRCPHVNRHNSRVFIPCKDDGVLVARLEADSLVRENTLTCVNKPHDMAVISPNMVYISDWDSDTVKVVDVTRDVITTTLKKPDEARYKRPFRLAALGDSIMVTYDGPILVVYHHDNIDPIRVIHTPEGLQNVSSISTDGRDHFLLTDCETRSLFVVNVKGTFKRRININTDSKTLACAVVGRQLWVGCSNGDLIFMSSYDGSGLSSKISHRKLNSANVDIPKRTDQQVLLFHLYHK